MKHSENCHPGPSPPAGAPAEPAPTRRQAGAATQALPQSVGSSLLLTALFAELAPLPLQHVRNRRIFRADALKQRRAVLVPLGAVVNAESSTPLGRAAPQAAACVLAILAQDVIRHAGVLELVHVVVEIARDATKRIHAGFLRRHALPHILDNRVSAGHPDVFLARTCRACRANVLVGVFTRADDGCIAAASGQLPCQAAGGGHAGHFTLRCDRGAMNGPVRRKEHVVDGFVAIVGGNANTGGEPLQSPYAVLEQLRLLLLRGLPVGIEHAWTPPVGAGVILLPQLPLLPRTLGE